MVFLAVVLALVCFSGCATTYELRALPSDKVSMEYKSGELIQKSFKTNAVAVKVFKSKVSTAKKGGFVVAIANLSQSPILFSPKCISIEADGRQVKIYSYEELKKEIEQRARQLALATVLLGMGAAMQVNRPQYGTITAWGPGGFSSGTYSIYDPASVAATQAMIGANMVSQINAIENMRNSDLQIVETVLREHTLYPQETYAGLVVFEPPKEKNKQTITLKITLGSDVHEFKFLYSKVEE